MLSCVRAGAVESELEKELGALRKEEAILKVPSLSLSRALSFSLSLYLPRSPSFGTHTPQPPRNRPASQPALTRTHKHAHTNTN